MDTKPQGLDGELARRVIKLMSAVNVRVYKLTRGRIGGTWRVGAGWRKPVSKKISLDLFAGVDNLFDARYSLGNDINATGGRYYNTAAGVNYFAGLAFNFSPTNHMSGK